MKYQPFLSSEHIGRSFKLLFHPKLRLLVFIPLALNILLFSLLIWISGYYFNVFTGWFEGFIPSWLHWLEWLLWITFVLITLFIFAYTFTFIANLVAAPFNGLLAERVQRVLTQEALPSDEGLRGLIAIIPRSIARQISLLIYYLPRVLGLLILSFIPIVQVVATPLWFIFNGWMMSLQYCDYPTDNNRISFTEMRKMMKKQRFMYLEFGIVISILTMIPIINLMIMPVAVIAATMVWFEKKI